jgi:hypothetical protein
VAAAVGASSRNSDTLRLRFSEETPSFHAKDRHGPKRSGNDKLSAAALSGKIMPAI